MTARPCLGCGAPVRCNGRFVLCSACWLVARDVCRREYDALPAAEQGPAEWQRFANAFMTDLAGLTEAICGERAAVAARVA